MKAVSSLSIKSTRTNTNHFYSRPPSHPHPSHSHVSNSNAAHPHPRRRATTALLSLSCTPPSGISKKSKSPSVGQRLLAATEIQRQRRAQINALGRDVWGLLEEEYREDIINYMHEMELATMSSAASMDMQPELQWQMRTCLIDFLIEVHLTFRLRPETLYLTSNIVDRYVSKRVVYKKHYQLVGCAALWIAAKFEDAKERVPSVLDLKTICRDAYEPSAFVQMEGHVLATIGWIVGHPTAESWLRIACCGDVFEDTQTQHVARFLMEVTLFYREYVGFTSSAVADAALLLARFTVGKARRPFDAPTPQVMTIVKLLDTHLSEHLDQVSDTLVKKYSYSYYSKASTYIIQFYLQGRRYFPSPSFPNLPSVLQHPLVEPPSTPVRTTSNAMWTTPSSAGSSTPGLTSDMSSSSSSDIGDLDYIPSSPSPLTPSLHHHSHSSSKDDLFFSSENKENYPTTVQPPSSLIAPLPTPVLSSNAISIDNVPSKFEDMVLCAPSPLVPSACGNGNVGVGNIACAGAVGAGQARSALHALNPVNGVGVL